MDYDAGLYPSAAKRFEAIVEADDTFMKAFDNLGLCYEALNQPDQAIGAYRKAIALNRTSKPPSYWPPLNLGALLRTAVSSPRPRRCCARRFATTRLPPRRTISSVCSWSNRIT